MTAPWAEVPGVCFVPRRENSTAHRSNPTPSQPWPRRSSGVPQHVFQHSAVIDRGKALHRAEKFFEATRILWSVATVDQSALTVGDVDRHTLSGECLDSEAHWGEHEPDLDVAQREGSPPRRHGDRDLMEAGMGRTMEIEGGVIGKHNAPGRLGGDQVGVGPVLRRILPRRDDEVQALADASDLTAPLGIKNQLPGSMVAETGSGLNLVRRKHRWAKKSAASLVVIAILCSSSRERIEDQH